MDLTLQYDQTPFFVVILLIFAFCAVVASISYDISEMELSAWTVIFGIFLLIGGIGFAYAVIQTPQNIDKESLQAQAQEVYDYDLIDLHDNDELSDASGTFENPAGDRLDCNIRIIDLDSLPTKFTPINNEDIQAEAMLICNGTEPKTVTQ
ncbi:hypothetical protein M3D63_09585 [Kocuria palustris]|uniref:hypothetical protein n=1 Tax=Kocuria palustris TaxID=71999 RepID=UPI0021A4A78E|nr:hypothetical protein [Kocuria palustris]MCT1835021.1 hypothetical protein [Kocuria palustris]MDH5151981.1 hypothetical protein [Kocuria palustris]